MDNTLLSEVAKIQQLDSQFKNLVHERKRLYSYLENTKTFLKYHFDLLTILDQKIALTTDLKQKAILQAIKIELHMDHIFGIPQCEDIDRSELNNIEDKSVDQTHFVLKEMELASAKVLKLDQEIDQVRRDIDLLFKQL